MMIALLCLMVPGQVLADTWDGSSMTRPVFRDYHDGYTYVFLIQKASDLAYIREHWTDEKTYTTWEDGKAVTNWKKFYQCNYVLTTDLDMGDAVSWEPIGKWNPFNDFGITGNFYGNGHTIRIHIWDATDVKQGLFMRIGPGGKVQDLHLSGEIACSTSRMVGGIAGESFGTVENCWVSANVGSDWHEPSSAYTAKVGGIVGENHGTIQYCCMSGNVKNDDADVGGLTGYNNDGTVSHCTFYGTRISSHDQYSVFIGDEDGSEEDLHTTFTDEELASHINSYSTYKMYCNAIQHPYSITLNTESEGSLTADVATARPGQTVTLTPAAGNNIGKIIVKDVDGNIVKDWLGITDASYALEMPRSNVTITTVDATWTGSGTAEDPYLIPTAEAWERIHTTMMEASTEDCFENTYFKQTANINITQGIGVTGNPNDKKFCGIYDGDGHKLNCTLTNPVSGSYEAVAPFHNINGATIKNLYVTGTISGGIHTAGLVAYSDGTVTINNVRVAADVTCAGSTYSDAHGGGIVGHAKASDITIKNSLFDGKLTAIGNNIGDIRLGAIVGWGGDRIYINECFEKGTYEGTTDNSQTAFCWKDNDNAAPDSYENNFRLSDLGHNDGADKPVKVTSGTEGLELSYPDDHYDWEVAYHGAMFKSSMASTRVCLIGGQYYALKGSTVNFTIEYPEDWMNVKIYNGEKEVLQAGTVYFFTLESDEDVTITATYTEINWIDDDIAATEFSTIDEANKVVTITTPEELALLSKQVKNGTTTGEDWTYKLGADLDMSAHKWTPIGNTDKYFKGTFDGQGHTISGIKLTDSSKIAVGLFGSVQGTVKNLKLTDSEIQGKEDVGGIVGMLQGTVENCRVGSVTVKAVAVEGENNSGTNCGGIAGSCGWETSLLKGNYSAATVSGKKNIGGIVGDVFSGTMEANISMATVSGNEDYGMVVGHKANSSFITMSKNYYIADAASTNSNDVRAFNVKMSSDLTSQGFDFTYDGDNTEYDISQVKMYDGQFQLNGEWYVPADGTFKFKLPTASSEYLWLEWSDVKVNDGNVITPSAGVYSFDTTGDTSVEFEINATVIKGSPVTGIDGIEQSDNVQSDDDAIYDLSGRKVSNGQMPKGIYIQNGKKVVIKK